MTSTNATTFAPAFTYKAAATAVSQDPALVMVEWNSRPLRPRCRSRKSFSDVCCSFIEATISASVSWIASFIIMGLIHCATLLAAQHTVVACLQRLGSFINGF